MENIKKVPAYMEQREKIIQAYYKNELNPYSCHACFVGNLLNNTDNWANLRTFKAENGWQGTNFKDSWTKYNLRILPTKEESSYYYSSEQIANIEENFLKVLNLSMPNNMNSNVDTDTKEYEEALFKAMDSTLDLLLEIHIKNGDETAIELQKPKFVKRQLQTS